MAKSDNLRKAKKEKNDEFYTQLSDIEAEISSHPDYVRQFQGKVVLCNCDDPEWSNFYEFFRLHFKQLGLKKLITTHYNKDGSPSYKLELSGEMMGEDTINMIKTPLEGDGDFRSEECIELLKEADIVVTNPPFSLFREYVALLVEHDKKFVIIGSDNAIAYKEIFPLLRDEKVIIGYTRAKEFKQPDGSIKKFGNIGWYTNLDLDKSHEPLILTKNYKGNETKYPKYDNYDAIEVGNTKDIPKDYMDVMAVPLTIFAQLCVEQFEILGYTAPCTDKCIKFYENMWQHDVSDKIENGEKVRDKDFKNGKSARYAPMIALPTKPDSTCYTADNATGFLVKKYFRILIRRKVVSSDENS